MKLSDSLMSEAGLLLSAGCDPVYPYIYGEEQYLTKTHYWCAIPDLSELRFA